MGPDLAQDRVESSVATGKVLREEVKERGPALYLFRFVQGIGEETETETLTKYMMVGSERADTMQLCNNPRTIYNESNLIMADAWILADKY